jgi:hypothetical protein
LKWAAAGLEPRQCGGVGEHTARPASKNGHCPCLPAAAVEIDGVREAGAVRRTGGRTYFAQAIAGDRHRFAIGQELGVHLAKPPERFLAPDERQHAAVRRKRRADDGIGKVGELCVLDARRRELAESPERHAAGDEDDEKYENCESCDRPPSSCIARTSGQGRSSVFFSALSHDTPESDNDLAHRLVAIGGLLFEALSTIVLTSAGTSAGNGADA